MQIRCKLVRVGGTQIDIEGRKYDFQPNDVGDHVCEVTHKGDIGRLLAITEGYEVYGEVGGDTVPSNEPNSSGGIDGLEDGEGTAGEVDGDTTSAGEQDGGDVTGEEEVDPLTLGDEDLLVYARDNMGIENPEDKDELEEYASELYGINIDKRKNHITLIRTIIEASQAENE